MISMIEKSIICTIKLLHVTHKSVHKKHNLMSNTPVLLSCYYKSIIILRVSILSKLQCE